MAKSPRTSTAAAEGSAKAPARPAAGARQARTVESATSDEGAAAARPAPRRRRVATDEAAAPRRTAPRRAARRIAPPEGELPAVGDGPSADDIARRAYEIYETRGADHGSDVDDWLEAERQLRDELTQRR